MKRRRGFTLVEAVVALFVLIIAFLLVSNLFHTALGYTGQVERQINASVVAARKVEELRDMSRSEWLTYTGEDAVDPDDPSYRVKVEVANLGLSSPCTSLEEAFPSDSRQLSASMKKMTVTVTWGDRLGELQLDTLLAEPPRPWDGDDPPWKDSNPLVVSPSTAVSVGHLDHQDFTVTAYDEDGNEIDDLFFRWYVEPKTGNGTVEQARSELATGHYANQDWNHSTRDGRTVTFTHRVVLPDGTITGKANGTCRVSVRAVYRGVEAWGQSADVTLTD